MTVQAENCRQPASALSNDLIFSAYNGSAWAEIGRLTQAGRLTVANGLVVTAGGLTVSAGAVAFGGRLAAAGGLDVTGTTTMSNSLQVSGIAGIGGGVLSNVGLAIQAGVSDAANSFGIYTNQTLTLTANTAQAFGAQINSTVATGTFTGLTYYGLSIAAPAKTGTGTIATAYGLYISAPTIGTANKAVYISGNLHLAGGGWEFMVKPDGATGELAVRNNSDTGYLGIHVGTLAVTSGGGFWGHAVPGAQPAAPVTLADVIAIIRGCGLSA